MKIFYFLIIFAGFNLTGQGQVLEDRIKKFAIEKNIDSFLVYSYSCNYDIIFGDCALEEPHYLFWHESDKWYIKRFDYCETFWTIQVDSLNSLAFYLHHPDVIDGNNMLPQTNNQTTKRRGRKKALGAASPVRFTCLYAFNYHSKEQLKKVIIDKFYLNMEHYDNKGESVDSVFGQQAGLKSLVAVTENMIKQLNDGKRFVVE